MKKSFSQLLPLLLLLPVAAAGIGLLIFFGEDLTRYLTAAVKLVVLP